MRHLVLEVVVAFLCGLVASVPLAAADANVARGARAFQQCAACHSLQPGRHLTGPSLAHVWGRKAATAEGFQRYSEALKRSGLVWNQANLDKWLANPQALVPGTAMTFPGIRAASVRADLIGYLEAVSEGKAPAPSAGGMMGAAAPAELRQADANAHVLSLHHCRDTYIVRTAAGPVQRLWEYNVRLKTDSSDHGPTAGKPVITGSGMRGDRVSIVFASPAEISQFIKESCE